MRCRISKSVLIIIPAILLSASAIVQEAESDTLRAAETPFGISG
jgi:hypothetical protein